MHWRSVRCRGIGFHGQLVRIIVRSYSRWFFFEIRAVAVFNKDYTWNWKYKDLFWIVRFLRFLHETPRHAFMRLPRGILLMALSAIAKSCLPNQSCFDMICAYKVFFVSDPIGIELGQQSAICFNDGRNLRKFGCKLPGPVWKKRG